MRSLVILIFMLCVIGACAFPWGNCVDNVQEARWDYNGTNFTATRNCGLVVPEVLVVNETSSWDFLYFWK